MPFTTLNTLKGKFDVHCLLSIPVKLLCSVESSSFVVGHYVGDSFRPVYETHFYSSVSHLKRLHKKSYPLYKPVVLRVSVNLTKFS